MNEVFNVVISSKNRKNQDTNSSMVVKLQEDFFIENDEELYVCMSSFNMIKSFYSVQTGLNDHFQIIVRLTNDDPNDNIEDTFDFFIQEGNYNVKTFVSEIKRLTNTGFFDMIYDNSKNKYLFKNSYQMGFELFLKPINSGILFGFENNTEYFIDVLDGTYSSKHVNLSGYTSLIIKLDGDICIDNTISNIDNHDFVYDRILGIININDVAPMDSIIYQDNGNCMFRHRINNKKIPSFHIKIVNEDGVEFPQMGEWILMLKFEKVKLNNSMLKVEKLLENINFMFLSIYSYMGITSIKTLEDVLNR